VVRRHSTESDSLAALRARVQSLEVERDALAARTVELEERADRMESRAAWLAKRVARLAYLLYGRRSEKLTRAELTQLALSLGATESEATRPDPQTPHPDSPHEELRPDALQPTSCGSKPSTRKHPGRGQLSPEIERTFTRVRVPEGERLCDCCGAEMVCFTTVDHERIEHIPERLIVHVEQREVLGCKQCRGAATTAPRSTSTGVRRAGPSLMATLIESKCDDALPIYRQRDRMQRLGFDVPLNTLYGYFAHGTDLIIPVAKATESTVLGQSYVNVDDTTIKVLDRQHPKGRKLGRLWCFVGELPLVAFAFTDSWAAVEVAPYLLAIPEYIQCDDYGGYEKSIRTPDGATVMLVPPERRLGCMMHVRRRFYAALKLGFKDAAEPILSIREIYTIEALARERKLDAPSRLALREQESLPWLARFNAWVASHEHAFAPKSKLAEAVRYAKQQRQFVDRCFTDGRFEIDNGAVERAIREPAIGRRNYLFTGSREGAKRLAAAYTLVQSCRALGISTRDYLIDIMTKIEAGWPLRRLTELVPTRWAEDRGLWTPPSDSQPTS